MNVRIVADIENVKCGFDCLEEGCGETVFVTFRDMVDIGTPMCQYHDVEMYARHTVEISYNGFD